MTFAINKAFIRKWKAFNLHTFEGRMELYKSFKSISKPAHFCLDFTASQGTSQKFKAVNRFYNQNGLKNLVKYVE